ncbi:endonuclease MutS2 [Geofilum rubicundum]|uniref:Endonuclease MutS2 n=1 Tax=Geofilum rubicundum JCM 15548 TaxID=1236989 RepID=A0A0E9LS92_9BACT|nr:Smr/MutS family protein [Geofilum rubicundum]GAO28437.1 recombination inhibitory protein MutS2 [Geofilum rubicundum JCM 15548]
MIYPETFEQKLNFGKIRELLWEHCLSGLGREWISRMSFSTSYEEVTTWLQQTDEMQRIEADGGEFPVTYFIDVRGALKRIRVEGLFLEEGDLFDLRRSLGTIRDIIRFIRNKEVEVFPQLHALVADVMIYPAVIDRIDAILNKQGKIKDNATPELARLRKEVFSLQQSVSRRMIGILKKAQQDGLVESDVSISIRDGRAVIPVLSANKRKLPGIVHDESATGKTTYIEPAEIVEINNEIREIIYAERREVAKILADISAFIRPYLDDLLLAYDFLGIIDFIRAKARFAQRIEGIVPEVDNTPAFRWVEARHPLLFLLHKALGKTVVPLSIEFTADERIVLISGPNAGGKSVCLQTVGLVQYMLQCGLPVPVDEGSRMGFYEHILLDLGDEQSIENDLSTYSSHLLNMKNFVRYANNRSLLLIDEFGTGTEPMLGGAIAEAVLEQLNQQGAYGVITTHYTNLKHYASQTDGIVNGAMQFDTHQLQPLFKLEVGSPGSSFAFEIARKIGLSETILAAAKERLGEDHIHFDKHLREIIRDKRYWEQKRRSIRDRERKLEGVSERYEKELEQLTRERKGILDKAKQEAAGLLSNANKEIENTIRQIRETQADKEKTRLIRKELDVFKEGVDSLDQQDADTQQKLRQKMEKIQNRRKKSGAKEGGRPADESQLLEQKSSKPPVPDTIAEGDMVKWQGQPIPGEVMEIKGKNALIAFGQLITNVKVSRLEKLSRNEYKKELRSVNSVSAGLAQRMRDKKLTFKPDIDLRGMRADEAIDRVTTHMDEAVMCGVSQVKILHGKGTGALRQMIREYLGTLPFVVRYADEHVQHGGSGITVVDLD